MSLYSAAATLFAFAAPLCPKIVGPITSLPAEFGYSTELMPVAPFSRWTNFNRGRPKARKSKRPMTSRTVCAPANLFCHWSNSNGSWLAKLSSTLPAIAAPALFIRNRSKSVVTLNRD